MFARDDVIVTWNPYVDFANFVACVYSLLNLFLLKWTWHCNKNNIPSQYPIF